MADSNDTNTPASSFEGPGKGKAFFDRAKTVATTGNYDYAIDMYIEGLNREPDNIDEHKALRDVALRRKIGGGKPAGGLMGPKLPYKGKTPKEAMLNAEFVLAKDVGHIPSMLTMVRNASLADYRNVVNWIGPMLREANRTTKTPKFEIYVELVEIFKKHKEFNKASEAMKAAMEMKPNDMALAQQAMALAAMETLDRGNYEKADSFTDSIRDKEGTKQMLEQENLNKSKEYLEKIVESARLDYEKNPTEVQVIVKYAKSLSETDDMGMEDRAIEMLLKAFAETKVYRFKVMVGDIKMKQFNRGVRELIEKARAHPGDADIKHKLEALHKERLAFEVEEFKERSENFPTDMHVRYEYGRRLFYSNRFEEAIGEMQEAQTSAKDRVDALHILGRSFMAQKMIPEALDTFRRSIDEYDLATTGDRKSKDLHYWYARALEENRSRNDAIEMYSKIVRWDIKYGDALKRLNALRKEKDDEEGKGPAGS